VAGWKLKAKALHFPPCHFLYHQCFIARHSPERHKEIWEFVEVS
jgi:hypothetical protein